VERLNDDGQWIVLMGFVISIAIFFLAILLNQSVLVGQTTAESVLEFPKSDIQDLRSEVWVIYSRSMVDPSFPRDPCIDDINHIAMARKSAVIRIVPDDDTRNPPGWILHYNNGITDYTEEVGNDETGYYYFYY
jgi:hypothetical protein